MKTQRVLLFSIENLGIVRVNVVPVKVNSVKKTLGFNENIVYSDKLFNALYFPNHLDYQFILMRNKMFDFVFYNLFFVQLIQFTALFKTKIY